MSPPSSSAASAGLPPVRALPTLPEADLTATLDLLFEPSVVLHDLALPTLRAAPFDSYPALINAFRSQLLSIAASADSSGPDARKPLYDILGSHPRLGEPKKEALSAQSAAEQKQLQGGGDEARRLAALNKEYEERFPGLRYVVFVNGRSRDVIMEDMRRRIDRGDIRAEEQEAIQVRGTRITSGPECRVLAQTLETMANHECVVH